MKKNNGIWIFPLNTMGIFLITLSISFKSIAQESSESVKDIDGNIYKTVRIGSQTWIVENLKTTKYNNGTPIHLVTDSPAWSNSASAAYCWYNNDISNKDLYGALYNWYAVNTGKLCPKGWHLPTDAEWTKLSANLGEESGAGGKLKETGTNHWSSPNIGATNQTSFTALPGGYRTFSGLFDYFNKFGSWWSSTELSSTYAWSRFLKYNNGSVERYEFNKKYGFSVRCMKN